MCLVPEFDRAEEENYAFQPCIRLLPATLLMKGLDRIKPLITRCMASQTYPMPELLVEETPRYIVSVNQTSSTTTDSICQSSCTHETVWQY